MKHQKVINLFIALLLIISTTGCKQENPKEKDYKKFMEAMEKMNYSTALDEINQVIKKYPKSIMSYSSKVSVLITMKNFQEAIIACDKMLVLNPNSAETLTLKGMLLVIGGEEPQAEICFKMSSELYKKLICDSNYIKNKRSNALNLVGDLFLLGKNEEAESVILENNLGSLPNEIPILEILRTKTKLEICKTFLGQ